MYILTSVEHPSCVLDVADAESDKTCIVTDIDIMRCVSYRLTGIAITYHQT